MAYQSITADAPGGFDQRSFREARARRGRNERGVSIGDGEYGALFEAAPPGVLGAHKTFIGGVPVSIQCTAGRCRTPQKVLNTSCRGQREAERNPPALTTTPLVDAAYDIDASHARVLGVRVSVAVSSVLSHICRRITTPRVIATVNHGAARNQLRQDRQI